MVISRRFFGVSATEPRRERLTQPHSTEDCFYAAHLINRMQKLVSFGRTGQRVVDMVQRKDKDGPQNTTHASA